MVKKEFYLKRNDGVDLYRTYSDEDFKIKQVQTGYIYDEAIDVADSEYTYEETDMKIEHEETIELEVEVEE